MTTIKLTSEAKRILLRALSRGEIEDCDLFAINNIKKRSSDELHFEVDRITCMNISAATYKGNIYCEMFRRMGLCEADENNELPTDWLTPIEKLWGVGEWKEGLTDPLKDLR